MLFSGEETLTVPKTLVEIEAEIAEVAEAPAQPEPKAPMFLETINPVVVMEGEEARFDAHVDGIPEPTIDWYKNGELIPDEGRFVHIDAVKEEIFTLVIENTRLDDAGEYTCIAANDVDEVSCNAVLTVNTNEKAPEFTKEPETSTFDINTGKDVTLDLTVSGKPEPKVEWFKDDKPLKKTKRVDTSVKGEDHTLTIRGGKPTDSGTYKCVATNPAGTVSKTYDIHIKGN